MADQAWLDQTSLLVVWEAPPPGNAYLDQTSCLVVWEAPPSGTTYLDQTSCLVVWEAGVPVAVVPDISGAPTVLATFDGSGSQYPLYYAWEWTSVPGGSAISNYPKPLPDNGATSLMVDNVALWHFSDATDSSGEGNDLTLVNGPSFVTGKIGNALELNGSNQTAHITDASLQITGDMSLFTWVYLDTLGNSEALFYCGEVWTSPEAEADNILYLLRLNGTGGNMDYYHEYGAGTNQNVVVTGLVTAGQWCHIGFVRDTTAKTVKFYRDGTLIQTYSYTHNPTGGTASPLYIGHDSPGAPYADGKFDECAIWSRALSPPEVTEVYEQGSKVGLGSSTATAAFTPDIAGTYTVQLTVADGVSVTADAVIGTSGPENIDSIFGISKDNIGTIMGISYGDIDKINDID